MFNNFGGTEIIIIALLILLFFGGKRLPGFVKGITESIKEFRKSAKDKE